jgi:hypothetical protein
MPTDRSPLLVVAAAFLVATTLFCLRVHRQPLQPYGSNAAEYIEHAVRLEVADIAAAGGSPAAVLFAADDAVLTHPPGLHLLTLPAQRLLGREAEAIVWTGLGWHLLLALALGLCAAALGPGVGAEPHDGLRTRRFAAGLTTGLLFPAGLAASTRYHYDLPMTALLWCGVAALLLGRDRAPARAGLAAGALFACSSLVKWTALPLGGILAFAALVPGRRREFPSRLRATVALAVAWGVPVAGFLAGSLSSLQAGVIAVDGDPAGGDVGPLAVPIAFLARLARSLAAGDVGPLAWYPSATAVALFSPLLCAAAAPLVWTWWRGRRNRAFILIAVLGQWAALTLGVSVLDERFALTAAPALLLAAALGAATLEPRSRWPLLAATAAALVCAEFQLAPAGLLNGPRAVSMGPSAPALTARGPWLGDSFERRGWSSAASTPSSAPHARAALVEALERCGVQQLGYVDGLSDQGDSWWLRYRARLAGRERLVLTHGSLGPRRFWWPDPDTAADAHAYEALGFSMDSVGEPGAFGGMTETELTLNLRALGLRVAALDHFQPTVALARVHPAGDSPIDDTWRELERIQADDAEPLALFGRGAVPCPGPPFEPPPR